MTIHVKRAYRHGYRRGDLEDLQDDDYCRCPAYECRGDVCGMCMGDGSVPRFEAEQQRDRVLIYAKTDAVPPLIARDFRLHGVWQLEEAFLSRAACAQCRDDGLLYWFCSFLGDELSLTPKGEAKAVVALRRQERRMQQRNLSHRTEGN